MLIMENSEEVLQILERFTKLKQKDIPKELDDYLCYVAKTGDTVYRWANIKYLFREKLVHVIKDFHDTTPSIDDLPQYPNVDPFNYETMKSSLLERLEMFNAAPFTVQRLCELLTDPRKQYSRIDKFMRALEKNILVVSTVEPGRKQPESENGDSLDSVVNGDLSLDVNVDIDMESESIFSMEAQNTTTTVAAPSSSTSIYTKSDTEESAASLPKKPKLDIGIDDNTETTKAKSDSESESETSDDSDSSDSKETVSKEESEISQSNKVEVCEVHTTSLATVAEAAAAATVEEKTDDDKKENQCELKTVEKIEDSVKTTDTNEAQAQEEASVKESKVNSEKLDNDSKNETNNTSLSLDSIATSTVIENVASVPRGSEESKEKQKDGLSLKEISDLKTQQSTKADSTDSCVEESEKSKSETDKVDEIQQNLEYQHTDIPSNISSSLVTEADNTQSVESTVNDAAELIQKDNSNIALIYPECSEAAVSSSSSDVVNKIPEQMSVEDSSSTSTLLLPQIQKCSEKTAVLTASASNPTSTNIIPQPQPQQQVRDQPMDENLDASINVCTMAAIGNSTAVTDHHSGVVDELMQSESEQMATDTIIKSSDDKIDLSGMDVDDTSQEEAMDQ